MSILVGLVMFLTCFKALRILEPINEIRRLRHVEVLSFPEDSRGEPLSSIVSQRIVKVKKKLVADIFELTIVGAIVIGIVRLRKGMNRVQLK